MAGVSVSVRTGPVTATQRAYDVPKEKWSLLLQRRKYFLQVNIPHDCRLLFDFIEDARAVSYTHLDVYKRQIRSSVQGTVSTLARIPAGRK